MGLVVNAADGQFVGWNVRPQPGQASSLTDQWQVLVWGLPRQELERPTKWRWWTLSALSLPLPPVSSPAAGVNGAPEAEITDFLGRHQLHFPLVMECAEIVVFGSSVSVRCTL